MIRKDKAIVGALSALLALGMCGAASAQTTQPSDTESSAQRGATNKQTQQERFDREKVTLKDRVQQGITSADANIDALKRMSDNDKGDTKKRDEDMQKKLSMLRDHLQSDLDKIDKSTVNDWNGVRPVVDRDLTAMDNELRRVASVTKVQTPATGAANKQPTDQNTQQPSQQQQKPQQ